MNTGADVVPAVSVVVSTRNRPAQILPCVESILASNSDATFEVVVVDQSDTDETKNALSERLGDRRLRYIATETRGLSRSRNVAVFHARAPILAFTDDDCRVPEDWIAKVKRVMDAHPSAALVFGCVDSPAEYQGDQFAAEFRPSHDREITDGMLDIGEPWGVGANMIVRRSTLDRVGPFDPVLGAGAPFRASEDSDIAIRVVAAGLTLFYSTELLVHHLGVRHGSDASDLMRGYGTGIGAVLAKHLRLSTKGSGRMATRWLVLHAPSAIGKLVSGQRPTGLGYVVSGIASACRSLTYGIDRDRSIYQE